MKLSRRQWLRNASLTSGLALLGGSGALSALTDFEKEQYNPRPLADLIRLGSNENPYGPSLKMRQAMEKGFDLACRYPWAYNSSLQDMIAKKEGVPSDHIVLTAGSTEGLKIAGITYSGNGGEIISGLPTFLSLMSYSEVFGAKINWVPLDKEMNFDLQEIENRINSNTKLVFLCNPNNPTGKLLPAKEVLDFCDSVSNKTVVFSDEAYYDYIEEANYPSMVELVKKGKNVIVSKTLSKVYGLAGIRIGYLVAKPEIAKKLSERIVANTNIMAIEAGKAALQDEEFYSFSLRKNLEARKSIESTLDNLGLTYIPSQANFVFFDAKRNVVKLGEQMLNKGIIVGRPFPPFMDWCRISTGTKEEVELFNKAITELYS